VQETFSTMSTKISSRALPPARDVSSTDLITPVGPRPTPAADAAAALPFCARARRASVPGGPAGRRRGG